MNAPPKPLMVTMTPERLQAELARHHADGFGWAMSCCAWDRNDAEDVLHVRYLKILEGKARFEGRSSFRTWLFAVIHRTALEHHRRARRRRAGILRLVTKRALEPSEPVPPDAFISCDEANHQLRDALKALPRRQQEVLHLVFYQGRTIAEAATVLEISLGTARTHYERGKAKLRESLAEAVGE